MKTILIGLGLFFLGSWVSILPAQTLGIKAGANFADVHNFQSADITFSPAWYYHFGAFGALPLSDRLQARLELLYSVKGGQDERDYQLQLNYLALPLMARLLFNRFTVDAGVEVAYKTGTFVSGDQVGNVAIATGIWDRDFDASLLLGLGYQFDRLEVGLRYNLGLVYLSDAIVFTDENGVPVSEMGQGRNSVFQLSLGFVLFEGTTAD